MAYGTDTEACDFEVTGTGSDPIRLEPINEYGSRAGCDILLTREAAIELLKTLAFQLDVGLNRRVRAALQEVGEI